MINNFDAAYRLLNQGDKPLENASFRNKLDLFFIDHQFVPLLVHEAYLNSMGDRKSMEDLEKMAQASDMMSLGDQMSVQIIQNQNWGLLPNFGMFSSVAPTEIIQGRSLYPGFPQWLGKNSTSRKAKRLIRELKQAMAHRVYADRFAVQNEIVPYLLQEIVTLMKLGVRNSDHLNDLILFLDDLHITNVMIKEHLFILSMDKKLHAKLEDIPPGVKAAFTRKYNKLHQDIVKKKGASKKEILEDDSESDEYDQNVLMDEDEFAEIKKAKKLEKE